MPKNKRGGQTPRRQSLPEDLTVTQVLQNHTENFLGIEQVMERLSANMEKLVGASQNNTNNISSNVNNPVPGTSKCINVNPPSTPMHQDQSLSDSILRNVNLTPGTGVFNGTRAQRRKYNKDKRKESDKSLNNFF